MCGQNTKNNIIVCVGGGGGGTKKGKAPQRGGGGGGVGSLQWTSIPSRGVAILPRYFMVGCTCTLKYTQRLAWQTTSILWRLSHLSRHYQLQFKQQCINMKSVYSRCTTSCNLGQLRATVTYIFLNFQIIIVLSFLYLELHSFINITSCWYQWKNICSLLTM